MELPKTSVLPNLREVKNLDAPKDPYLSVKICQRSPLASVQARGCLQHFATSPATNILQPSLEHLPPGLAPQDSTTYLKRILPNTSPYFSQYFPVALFHNTASNSCSWHHSFTTLLNYSSTTCLNNAASTPHAFPSYEQASDRKKLKQNMTSRPVQNLTFLAYISFSCSSSDIARAKIVQAMKTQ